MGDAQGLAGLPQALNNQLKSLPSRVIANCYMLQRFSVNVTHVYVLKFDNVRIASGYSVITIVKVD